MTHVFSQLRPVLRQRQIWHRTHGSNDLTQGKKQDEADESHLSLGNYPTIHRVVGCPKSK